VPPLVVGTTYYVSRVVGNVLNGQINLNDPCLDISPPIAVIWRPKPTVIALATSSTDLCPGDCITITANLSGTPPFFINGQFQQNGTGITPQIVNFSSTNPAIYTVCAPVNALSGAINYVICGLLDQFCENN
jgi:hypothetical protein